MGQHRVTRAAAGRSRTLLFVVIGVVVVLAGSVTTLVVTDGFGDGDSDSCTSDTTLTVNAAPSIAPALSALAERQTCGKVEVRAQDSASMIAALSMSTIDPEAAVWVPESTTLAQRTAESAAGTPTEGPSVASSPVVFGATEQVATAAGWPGTRPGWDKLIDPGSGVSAGITDPGYDPVASAALLGVQNAAGDPGKASEALRKMSNQRVESPEELYDHLPGGGRQPELSAFPTSEQQVVRHNAAHPKAGPGSMVASYPDAATPWLDFPYLVLSGTTPAERDAAARFQQVVLDPAAAQVLGEQGLRTPDGRFTGQADDRVDAVTPRTPPGRPEEPAAADALQRWAAADASGHVLTVIDVSGSMDAAVPGTGRTRMEVTVEAARAGFRLFKPSTELALWEFSTKLDGDKDYRPIVPWAPITKHLNEGLAEQLPGKLTKPKGATGLYDTTLAAYREATQTWAPGRSNLVVILTDGKNEDDNSISREQLLSELRGLAKPDRPLPVVFVGIGTNVDPAELNDIAGATGGQVALAPDVANVQQVFFQVLAKLQCPTGQC